MPRNESFHSIEELNSGIHKTLDKLNNKPFQKGLGVKKQSLNWKKNLPESPDNAQV